MAKAKKRIEQSDLCTGCGVCNSVCPINTKLRKADEFNPDDTLKMAIRVVDGKALVNEETCISCGACARSCPVESLTVVELAAA
jgi:4Fe-4S ferredoxin